MTAKGFGQNSRCRNYGKRTVFFLTFLGGVVLLATQAWRVFECSLTLGATSKGVHGILGSVRGALSIYRGDNEGEYPDSLPALLENRKYLSELSKCKTCIHPHSSEVDYFTSKQYEEMELSDTGRWGYVNGKGEFKGMFFVNCTHTDVFGKSWNSY